MMQWLRNSSPPVMERRVVEPGATFSLFENHWQQAVEVMENSQDAEGALTVISHLSQMISFLRIARAELSTETTCKKFWLENQCSEKVIKWLHNLQINGLQLPPDYEMKLVEMLHSLCEVAVRDGEILGYEHERTDTENWDGAYSLASLLLEYSLRSDPRLGDTARYSFILLIQLASRFSGLEKSLTAESGLGLTNVVISGLSACFSQLPTFEDSPSHLLEAFIVQLKFVEEVTEAASNSVASTIAECFSNSFLLTVIQPALTQDEGSRSLHSENDPYLTSLHEEIAVVTKYFQIICEQLTHPLLNHSIIEFVTSKLLPTLILRLNHINVSINVATLRLFTVLFEFYCEDFWHEVLLKYLIPQRHLMVAQRWQQLPDIDFHDASVRFLSLIPMNVTEALGSETLTSHFVQYLNSESERLTYIDSMVTLTACDPSIEPPAIISKETEGTNEKGSTNRNVIYPFWKFKYDGTDSISGKEEGKESDPLGISKSMESDEGINSLRHVHETKESTKHNTSGDTSSEFTAINLLNNSTPTTSSAVPCPDEVKKETELISAPPSGSEGYVSMDTTTNENDNNANCQIASFGPFLDGVLVQLSTWESHNPEVSLVLTELVSVLASSRIPLINTIILDSNLTLQPSYVTFMQLLKRIREDLDFRMKNNPCCTTGLIAEVWKTMDASGKSSGREASTSNRRGSNSDPNFVMTHLGSPSFIVDSFGEGFRKRISGGGTGVALVSAFQSVFSRKSGSPASSPRQVERHASGGTRAPNPSQIEAARMWATRAIIFSHWILELGAISQQLCWKRK